jgi:hypothetical protein
MPLGYSRYRVLIVFDLVPIVSRPESLRNDTLYFDAIKDIYASIQTTKPYKKRILSLGFQAETPKIVIRVSTATRMPT